MPYVNGKKYPYTSKGKAAAAKAAKMSKSQIRSAVARKRKAGNVGPKPTNVRTIDKKYYGGLIQF